MARFVEEEGLEREEKVEGVRGMLEGVVEGVSFMSGALNLADIPKGRFVRRRGRRCSKKGGGR